jgi:hypothetical protein
MQSTWSLYSPETVLNAASKKLLTDRGRIVSFYRVDLSRIERPIVVKVYRWDGRLWTNDAMDVCGVRIYVDGTWLSTAHAREVWNFLRSKGYEMPASNS